jgi:5-(carboxyamino)imidazole ribonucleotide synthase
VKIGILGGGQLARMMAQAGLPLGLDFVFLDPSRDACAGRYGELVVADWSDAVDHPALAACDRLTCDFENVPAETLQALARSSIVRPGAPAFEAAQDRLSEKTLLASLGIPLPPYAVVSARPDLLAAVQSIGLPAVLKTRRLGYDGKGQAVLRDVEDLEPAWQELGGRELILEGFVQFDHECAITVVRSASGETRFYPLSWTVHDDGILKLARAPAPVPTDLETAARTHARALVEALDYVGCLTLELFIKDGRLLANEFAPRVHNSAHWTIEGSLTSQFENHLRAVCDWPLGETGVRGEALMLNWIGRLPAVERLLSVPGLCWHDYGKAARPGRKVGHATLIAESRSELGLAGQRLEALLDPQMASLFSAEMAALV